MANLIRKKTINKSPTPKIALLIGDFFAISPDPFLGAPIPVFIDLALAMPIKYLTKKKLTAYSFSSTPYTHPRSPRWRCRILLWHHSGTDRHTFYCQGKWTCLLRAYYCSAIRRHTFSHQTKDIFQPHSCNHLWSPRYRHHCLPIQNCQRLLFSLTDRNLYRNSHRGTVLHRYLFC